MAKTAVQNEDVGQQAIEIMDRAFVLDGTHVFRVGGSGRPRLPLGDFTLGKDLIDDWRGGGLNAFIHPFAVFDTDMYLGQIKLLALWNSFIAEHPDDLIRIDKPGSFDQVKASGKIGVFIGSHHGEPFRNVDDVDYFYHLGLRSCIPATFGQNRLGTAVDEPTGGGLTAYGKSIVARMGQVGMAVDVSHCNEQTRLDAIEVSEKPVLITHGNPKGMCKNLRNISDEVLKAMAERGGVIGIMPLRMMLTDEEPTTLEDFIDHIDYVCDLVGPEYVGLGMETPIEGFDTLAPEHQIPLPAYMRNEGEQRKLDLPELYSIRRLYTVVESLLSRNYKKTDIYNIIGGNFERALREILTV